MGKIRSHQRKQKIKTEKGEKDGKGEERVVENLKITRTKKREMGAKRREEKVRIRKARVIKKELLPREKVEKERTRKIKIMTKKKIMEIKRVELKGREIRCRKVHKTNSGVST